MTKVQELPITALQFYATAPYPCSYLFGNLARSQVATPSHLINADLYSNLVHAGFRRSGQFTYRPYCDNCNACISSRVLVEQFRPNRSQKRTLKKHQNLQSRTLNLEYQADHFLLYQQYQKLRHSGGEMDQDDQTQYTQFLLQSRVNSRIIEFRDGLDDPQPGKLRMVSVIDILDQGISSVYTFYDASEKSANYGTYSILWQIEQAKLLRLPFLYLGYYIEKSNKMSYKLNFKPLEGLLDNHWRLITEP